MIAKEDRKKGMPINVRDANEADISFIFNSWLKSFRNGMMPRGVDNTIYYTEHHKIIERLMKKAKIRMAVDANDPMNILGFMCHERIDGIFVLHYCYTKHVFRRLHVFTELLKDSGHDTSVAALYSHDTPIFSRMAQKYNLLYHPYTLINYNSEV